MKICLLLLLLIVSASLSIRAQNSSLTGTWILTGADKLLTDGTLVPDYGSNPEGIAIFTADGYYSVQIYNSERLKFSSGDKFNGTPEEYQNVSLSMSTHFGTYSIDPLRHTITFHINHSSVPNIDHTVAVREYELKSNVLSWRVAPRQDGSIPITTLRRASDTQSKRIALSTPGLPTGTSAAVWAGNTLYVSGWLDPDIKSHPTTELQTVSLIKDVEKLLQSQGLTLGDVVMMHVYLGADPAKEGKMDFAGMMAGYTQFFGTKDQPNKPARTTVQVVLPAGARGGLIEIDIIAVRPD